jgi:hypothetical protein
VRLILQVQKMQWQELAELELLEQVQPLVPQPGHLLYEFDHRLRYR